MKPLFGVIVLG